MINRKYCRREGFLKGVADRKATGRKSGKFYIDNFFQNEPPSLSTKYYLEFIKGWQDGFSVEVSGMKSDMAAGGVKNDFYDPDQS